MDGIESRGTPGGQVLDARGWTAALATLSGALLLLLTALLSLVVFADILARYLLNDPLIDGERYGAVETYFGLGFAVLALPALPAAVVASLVKRGEPPVRSRSALALVPGCILAIAATIAAFVILVLEIGTTRAMIFSERTLFASFTTYVFLFFPILVVLAAVLGGARSPESTAALAGPALLAGLFSYFSELSIASGFVALAVPAVAAMALLALMFAFAPARGVAPWVAGLALAAGMAVPLGVGVMTPTETVAALACFGLAIALPVRCFGLGQKLGPMLRQAATELAALIVLVVAAAFIGLTISVLGGAANAIPASIDPRTAVAYGAGLFFLLAFLMTPVFVLAASAVFVVQAVKGYGFDPAWVGTLMTLMGLSAMALRATRGRHAAAIAGGLPAPATLFAAIVFAGLGIIVFLVPDLVLAPVRAMLG